MSKSVPKILPLILLVLLIALIGIGIFRNTRKAVAPPIYDAVEYYMKAGNVWNAFHTQGLVNPMNVEPAFRPPGTLLISYPFGFSPDFRGFLFRLTFIPIVIFILAYWLLAESLVTKWSDRWLHLGVAAALASLTFFYQFEHNPKIPSPGWWGLMDAFFGSLCAMATALLLASVRKRNILLAMAGGALAAFTPLVKPVGLLMIAVILWHWAIEVLITHRPFIRMWRTDLRFRRYLVTVLPFIVVIGAAVVLMCFNTAYISPENRQFAADCLRYVRSEKSIVAVAAVLGVLPKLLRELHSTVGWHGFAAFVILSLIGIVHAIRGMRRGKASENDLRFLGAFAAFCGGIVWWMLFPGMLFRYLFPFIMIFLVVLAPHFAAALRDFSLRTRGVFVIAASCPLIFTLFLLYDPPSARKLQHLTGLNLSTGQYHTEVAQGKRIYKEANRRQKNLVLYSTQPTPVSGVVQATGIYLAYKNPGTKTFGMVVPLNWHTGILIRRENLVSADYILFAPPPNAASLQATLSRPDVRTFDDEQGLIEAWLTTASTDEGVEPLGGDLLHLLRVVDHEKFNKAYSALIAAHHWRDEFMEGNKENNSSPNNS